MDGLKPCPFCGGKAEIIGARYEREETYAIRCTECGATLGVNYYENLGMMYPIRAYLDKLEKEWNRRGMNA